MKLSNERTGRPLNSLDLLRKARETQIHQVPPLFLIDVISLPPRFRDAPIHK